MSSCFAERKIDNKNRSKERTQGDIIFWNIHDMGNVNSSSEICEIFRTRDTICYYF